MRALSQSKPYAQACLDIATQNQQQDQWLLALKALAQVSCDPEAEDFLNRPITQAQQAFDFLLATVEEIIDTTPKSLENFIHLVIENQRLAMLSDIHASYALLYQTQLGAMPVNIESAFALNDEQQQALSAALKAHLGVKPTLTVQVRSDLQAGAIIRIGDDVIDGSLKGQLSRFAQQLSHG